MYNQEIINKMFSYFTQRWGFFEYKRGWLKGNCIVCGKENKMGINIHSRRVNCFSCGPKSDPLQFILDIEGLTETKDVYKLLRAFEGAEYLNIDRSYIERQLNQVTLPEGYKLIGTGTSITHNLVVKYLKKRGFKIPSLQLAGVGYCAVGEYQNRIIIPYYAQGELIYFNARRYMDVGSKFKNPSYEELGVGKNTIIYNIDALAIYKKIYAVESATNALTLGPKSIGTGGKSLSSNQLSSIIRSPVERVSIMLDDDAYDKAIDLALELSLHKKVKVVRFPKGKDVNDLGKKITRELDKETPYLEYKDFLREKWRLKENPASI